MNIKWNKDSIFKTAKSSRTLKILRKQYPGAIKAAKRLGVYKEMKTFLSTPPRNEKKDYDEATLLKEASKFVTVTAFKKSSRTYYEQAIVNKPLWAEILKAMGKLPTCRTKEAYKKACNQVHNNVYDYSKVIFKTGQDKVTIVCQIHGDFSQSLAIHKQGHGCPECGITGFKRTLPGVLYYLSVNNGQAYKIGITNNSVEKRFSLIELSKCKVIAIWKFADGNDCYTQEQHILSTYKHFKYSGEPLLESGNTELFNSDILNLDKDT